MRMRDLVKVFKALSDPNRVRIIKMLEERPLCVCEITEILGLAPSTVSKHLSLLRDADFILDKKEGKWVYYFLNKTNNKLFTASLLPLLEQWLSEDEDILHDRERVKNVDRNQACNI